MNLPIFFCAFIIFWIAIAVGCDGIQTSNRRQAGIALAVALGAGLIAGSAVG